MQFYLLSHVVTRYCIVECIRYNPHPVSFPLQLLLLLITLPRSESVSSISLSLCNNAYIADKIVCWQMLKHILPGKRLKSNIAFTRLVCSLLFTLVTVTWTLCIMMQAGDIHPNPGPAIASTSSISSLASVSSVFNFSKLSNHLSVVHYNVQSLVPKLDLLTTELSEFDILAFTETWLNPSVPTNDLTIDSYRIPERKDRPGDSHGGVILYVKNNIHYTRRQDLELRGVESIWIELTLKHKHILFGVFYRPPNSEAVIFSAIEDSINLAVDSGVNDIIITGDFNLNMQNVQSARKITSLCEQLSLVQSIEEPTHFTETSSSLIDLLLVNNNEHLILSGVGDPFLHQDIRYHCPVFGVFNFRKPKCLSFKRRIWKYDDGNYEMLRQKASATNWNDFQNNDINTYCANLTEHLQSITEMCIPNKVITIRPSDPPWITTFIKRHIRKRKRAYKRAKQTNLPIQWTKFRNLRNRVTQLIRESKQSFNESMATKLKSDSLSPKQWWKLLKYFIAPNSKSSIPPS